ncbi:hypothetical protein CVV68_02325 [Arthrobacter livingstonensis]|uniref:LysM domain-containing protein n=1 Tax=Arthrobacter livingstonensis TaxID=670078 RepID=A0A2V5LF20_9MICC|nr:hypothetical protein [Arthrobacter livingstonensis]PYI69264.1 hypothetical protein CVV68_02325 [Arthrobacter livingstonensis]
MKRQAVADAAMTAAILFLGASLVFAGGDLLRRRTGGIRPAGTLELAEVVGAAAAGIGVAVALWWFAALVCAFISGVAQLHGRHRLATVTAAGAPAFMRRLVAVVLGLNLMASPMAMAAGPGGGTIDPLWHAATVAASPLGVEQAPGTVQAPPRIAVQAQVADRAAARAHESPPVNPEWTPQGPAVDPGPLARPELRPSARQGPSHSAADDDGEVVVQGGDSLWSIVASALGPYATDVEVAQAWPEWYRANRSVIGSDPNIILPGQVLHAPAG